MEIGDLNANGQKLVRRTNSSSTTHAFATIWVMCCRDCGEEYGCNSCDAHIRRCPFCDNTAAHGEPI